MDDETRARLDDHEKAIIQVSENTVRIAERMEALYGVSKMVFADVMALSENPLKYCETLRRRVLKPLPPPGASADNDRLLMEIERLIASLEGAKPG